MYLHNWDCAALVSWAFCIAADADEFEALNCDWPKAAIVSKLCTDNGVANIPALAIAVWSACVAVPNPSFS